FESDKGEKKTGENSRGDKTYLATYSGVIEPLGQGWHFKPDLTPADDLLTNLDAKAQQRIKDGVSAFRWSPDGEHYYLFPIDRDMVGDEDVYEIVFELSVENGASKKMDPVKVPSPVRYARLKDRYKPERFPLIDHYVDVYTNAI